MDVFSLANKITADDTEAIAAFRNVERVGQQTATKVTASIQQLAGALKTMGIDARTASVNGIERIVVSAMQLDQTNMILAKMAPGFQAVAIEATRAAAATEKVAAATKAASTAATATGTLSNAAYLKWGNAAIRASGAVMLMSDALSGSDKSLQKMLKTGSSIAFMFGPVGAVVGSVGIAASMIVDAFTKSRDAIDKAKASAQTFADQLKAIRFATSIPELTAKASVNDAALQAKQKEVDDATTALRIARERERDAPTEVAANARRAARVQAEQLLRLREKEIRALEQERIAINETVASLAQSEGAGIRATDIINAREEARREAIRQIEGEIGWLKQLRELGEINIIDLSRARTLEIQYTDALKDGNLTREKRLDLIRKINDAQAVTAFSLADTIEGRTDAGRGESTKDVTTSAAKGAAAAVARNITMIEDKAQREYWETLFEMGGDGATAFASGFAAGIGGAFDAVLSGGTLFEGIEALGKGLLASFGQILVEIGSKGLIANELVLKLFSFLGTPAGIAASLGLIALGAGMIAIGGAGGRGRGGGGRSHGGGGIGSGSEERLTRYSFNPQSGSMRDVTPQKPENHYYTILGSNPQLERFFSAVATKGERRGLRGRVRVMRG